MTFSLSWVIKEKKDSTFPAETLKTCPYSRKTSNLSAYSPAGRCLAWTGFYSRFRTAKDIHEDCEKDFGACLLYKAAAGGILEHQSEAVETWPVFTP